MNWVHRRNLLESLPLNDIIVPIPPGLHVGGYSGGMMKAHVFCYFYAYWHCRHLCRVTSWLLVHR